MEQTDKKISQMPPLQTVSGEEIVPVVKSGGNYSTLVSQIVALARQTMVEAQAGKGLSTNDFTDAFKAKLEGLSNYDDAEVRSLITAINGRLDTILGDGASSAIDTFNEIEAFLTGITDTQTLTGLLAEQKQTITSETDAKLSGKVDKVSGKGLSTNDYSNDEKAKLTALPTKAELDASFDAKLDKSKWNEEHGQFTIKDYFLGKRGNIVVANSEISGITPLLPLNKTYPIVLKNVSARGNAIAVGFYDAVGTFISYPEGIEDLNGDFTVTVDKYPADACYFRACSEKAGSTYTNGPSIESREGAVSEAIQASKLALFINLWDAAWTKEGKYDPQNAPDSQHPFMGNGLWFTFEEAIYIYDSWLKVGKSGMKGAYAGGIQAYRTVIPPAQSYNLLDMNQCFYNSINLEVFVTRLCTIGNLYNAFRGCTKLTTVKIHTLEYLRSAENCFAGCSSLTTVELSKLSISISFADSPLLSLSSMQYLVSNAANTTEITVTVHPDVYAKLTDTANAEWYAVTEAATAKQITFATTN